MIQGAVSGSLCVFAGSYFHSQVGGEGFEPPEPKLRSYSPPRLTVCVDHPWGTGGSRTRICWLLTSYIYHSPGDHPRRFHVDSPIELWACPVQPYLREWPGPATHALRFTAAALLRTPYRHRHFHAHRAVRSLYVAPAGNDPAFLDFQSSANPSQLESRARTQKALNVPVCDSGLCGSADPVHATGLEPAPAFAVDGWDNALPCRGLKFLNLTPFECEARSRCIR